MEITENPDPRFTAEIIDSLSEDEAIALFMKVRVNDLVSAKIWYYDYTDRLDELIAKDTEVAARYAEIDAQIERELASI